jgi:hypothetical protein
MTNQQHRITPQQADEIRKRHRGGESIYILGKAYGIAPQTVARILAFEIHRPRDRRVVPVVMTNREYALLALRAEESGVPTAEMAAVIFTRGLTATWRRRAEQPRPVARTAPVLAEHLGRR